MSFVCSIQALSDVLHSVDIHTAAFINLTLLRLLVSTVCFVANLLGSASFTHYRVSPF